MKTCTKCGETKLLDQFYREKGLRDGRRPDCKDCTNARKAKYNARPEVRKRRAEYDAAYRLRPGVAARNAERLAQYYASNPGIRWEGDYRRRMRGYGFIPRVVSFTEGELLERWGHACWHCGGPYESLDHYPAPVSRGGEHSLDNCRPSCMNCQRYSWREDFTPINTQETTA